MKRSLTTHNKFTALSRLSMILAVWTFASAPAIFAQGSRKDDIVFGPAGHPVSGATVRVCQSTATGTPCSPLATVYTDATLSVSSENPFQTDGIGNYHFYAPAGRYMIQISGPNITGTITQPDVILPADLSSTSSGNNISAFGLSLGGNLGVAGNVNIRGTLTTANFSPGTFSPSSLNVAGSAKIQGPRPWIDVTAYGANGTGSGTFGNDDTVPIQNAINAACSTALSIGNVVPVVYFPPGQYFLSQKQLPSTSAVFNLPCSIELDGYGYAQGGSAFPFMAHGAELVVANLGPSPNLAPVFSVNYPSGGSGGNFIAKNLTIVGDNQAVWVEGSITANLTNVCLANSGSGTDATPLKVTNDFWFFMDGGCLQSASTSEPVALFTGESGTPTDVFDVYIRNIITAYGFFQYDQRVAVADVGPGGFRFENITMESGASDGFKITCSNGNAFNFNGLTLENVTQSDNSDNSAAMVRLNCANSTLTGLRLQHVQAGNAGQGSSAVATAGTIYGYYGDDCITQCTGGITNPSNLPIGTGQQEQYGGGFDYVSDTSRIVESGAAASDRMRSDFVAGTIASNSPIMRFFSSGGSFGTLAIDPLTGYAFNNGSNWGFDSSFNETSTATINVNFAQQLPPTNLAGTAASGGSIPNGTYTAVIRTTPDNCTHQSAPSAQSAAVTLSGSNGTINWTWTLPSGYVGTNSGYCISLGNAYSEYATYVSGASTTSYSLTAAPSSGSFPSLVNTLAAEHVFTSTGLGINTTNPLFNLDLQGALGARFANTATPNASESFPYQPSCLTAINCSSFIPLSPTEADTFARANSSSMLGANWTLNTVSPGIFGIAGNMAYPVNTNNTAAAFWNGQAFEADQWSQITVGTAPNQNDQVVATTVRNAGSGVFTMYDYKCVFTGGSASRILEKRVTGTATTLASVASGCNNGDLLRLEVVGSHLAGFYNGALDLVAIDTAIASGEPGILAFSDVSQATTISNWIGGNLEGNETADVFNRPNFWVQPQAFSAVGTLSNCSSSASPAVCSSAPAGSVTIAAGATTVVVDTSAVTASSQIIPVFDESLGTKLGVTCNNASASESAQYFISARTPGTSFTIKTSAAPTTNPACLSYTIEN